MFCFLEKNGEERGLRERRDFRLGEFVWSIKVVMLR